MASFRAAECALLFAEIFAQRCAPTATANWNQSVHANPTTSYPKKSDAARKQEKPAPSAIPITPPPKSSTNTPVYIASIASLSAHTIIMSKNPDLPPPLLIPTADHDNKNKLSSDTEEDQMDAKSYKRDNTGAKSIKAIEEAKASPNVNIWFQAFVEAKKSIPVEDCTISRLQDGLAMTIVSEPAGTISLSTPDIDLQIVVKNVTIRDKGGQVVSHPKLHEAFCLSPVKRVSLFSSLGVDPALHLPQPFDVISDIAIGEKYSFSAFLDDGGILTVEALPVTKAGKAGMEGCYHDVSAGDFKFNLVLQWPDDDKIEKDYTVDVSMEFKTENNIVQREEDGRCTYHLEGSNTNLYIPDQYYGHFRDGDSEMMRLEVMEGGYPRIDTSTGGSSVFTFRFQKSPKIFYDPAITGFGETDYAPHSYLSDQKSFKAGMNATDLKGIFQGFTSFSSLDLNVEVMFKSAVEDTIINNMQWPNGGDLFFYELDSLNQDSSIRGCGIKASSTKKQLNIEIYEIRSGDHLCEERKKKAREQLKDEVQEIINNDKRSRRFTSISDTCVNYYIEKFGEASHRRIKRLLRQELKDKEELKDLQTIRKLLKENENKKIKLGLNTPVATPETTPNEGSNAPAPASLADANTNNDTGSTDGAGTDADADADHYGSTNDAGTSSTPNDAGDDADADADANGSGSTDNAGGGDDDPVGTPNGTSHVTSDKTPGGKTDGTPNTTSDATPIGASDANSDTTSDVTPNGNPDAPPEKKTNGTSDPPLDATSDGNLNGGTDNNNVDLSWWNHSNSTYIVLFIIVIMLFAILYLPGYIIKIEKRADTSTGLKAKIICASKTWASFGMVDQC